MNNPHISVVILTFNESVHIERAILNVRDWARDVFLVDSHSTDDTVKIAMNLGAKVFKHSFENYGAQREWALRNLPFATDWISFLDADELLTEDLKFEVSRTLQSVTTEISGFYVKRRNFWMGRWLRHGGLYPIWLLRFVRHKNAHCEERSVNEHIIVDGKTLNLSSDLDHVSLETMGEWTKKHLKYAKLEAEELIKQSVKDGYLEPGTQAARKRWLRENIWRRIPPLVRPFLYFIYRYICLAGFLDMLPGFIFHILQGFCFQFIIDVIYMRKRWFSRQTMS